MWEDEFDSATYARPDVTLPDPPVMQITREDLLQRLKLTDEEIEQARFAEQRSDIWFKAREGRLTASNFGAAAELNKHCSRRDLVRQMIWPHCFTGNEMTQWGTVMEGASLKKWLLARTYSTPERETEWAPFERLLPQMCVAGIL